MFAILNAPVARADPAGPIPNQTSAGGVQQTIAKLFFATGGDKLGEYKLGGTVIVSRFALQPWSTASAKGMAVFEYLGPPTYWSLKSMGRGSPDVGSLIALGVPRSIAEQLVAGTAPPAGAPIDRMSTPPTVLGIRLGSTMKEASAVALKRCRATNPDVKMSNGMWCEVGAAEPLVQSSTLHWAGSGGGVVYSVMNQYWVRQAASGQLAECSRRLEAFKESQSGSNLIPLRGRRNSSREHGKDLIDVSQEFGFKGQPAYDVAKNPRAPYFSFRCTNFAHADVWDDKILIQIVLQDQRLLNSRALLSVPGSMSGRAAAGDGNAQPHPRALDL